MITILGAGGAIAYEMLYQSDSPYIFDASKFARAFGFSGTPYSEGIRQTAAWFSKGAHPSAV